MLQWTARESYCCKRQHEEDIAARDSTRNCCGSEEDSRGTGKKNVVELEKDIDENGDEDPEGK